MGIPIPTGVRTKRGVELGRYYLLYTCPGCAAPGLSEQVLERTEGRSFSGLREQARPELDQALEQGKRPTEAEREQAEETLRARFRAGDCAVLERKVRCPRCGRVQPWSGMGRPWRRTLLAPLTALASVFSLLRLCFVLPGSGLGDGTGSPVLTPLGARLPLYAYFLLPLFVMALLDLGYVLLRRRRLRAAAAYGEKPAFYTRRELRDLARGPYGALVKPYLEEQAHSR